MSKASIQNYLDFLQYFWIYNEISYTKTKEKYGKKFMSIYQQFKSKKDLSPSLPHDIKDRITYIFELDKAQDTQSLKNIID